MGSVQTSAPASQRAVYRRMVQALNPVGAP